MLPHCRVFPDSAERIGIGRKQKERKAFMKKRGLSLILATSCLVGLLNSPQILAKEKIAGWTIEQTRGGICRLDSEVFCLGEKSLLISGENDKSTVSAATSFSAEKGKVYTVSFWAKNIGMSQFSCTAGSAAFTTTPITTVYNWTKFQTEYRHTGPSGSVEIKFNTQGSGKVYIDEVFAAEKNSGEDNRVTNSGFEEEGTVVLVNPDGLEPYTSVQKEKIIDRFADKKSMPFMYMDNFKCDGSLEEWSGYAKACLPDENCRIVMDGGYNGAEDLSADFQTAFDDNNIYISAEVTDDVHFQDQDGSNYWTGDSIQVAIGSMSEDFGIEVGFYLSPSGEAKAYAPSLDQGLWGAEEEYIVKLRENTKCAAQRNGNKTVYEMVIPWKIHFEEIPEDFLFDILINDNDGSGRKGYIEWTFGIGQTKNNTDFIAAIPVRKQGALYGYIEGNKNMSEGEPSWYKLYVVNDGNSASTAEITVENEEPATVVIPPESVYYHPFLVTDEVGVKKIRAKISDGTQEFEVVRNINVSRDLEISFQRLRENELAELKKLQQECKDKNIKTDYADIDVYTIERFIDYGLEDYNGGRESRAEYVYQCLETLYEEAKSELDALLSGTAQPKPAYFWRGDKIDINNQIFYSEMENSLTGEKEKRPMLLSGYVGNAPDAEEMSKVGANILQFEVAMYNYVGKEGSAISGWQTQQQGGSDVRFEMTGAEHNHGKYSVKLTCKSDSAAYRYGGIMQRLNLKAGETYKFSMSAKAENASAATWFPLGFITNYPRISLDGTYDWKKYTYEYTPDEDITIDTQINLEKPIGEVYVDDVKVVQKSTGEDLITNGGFETQFYTKNGYTFDTAKAQKEIIGELDECYKNNIAVNVLYSAHYFPTGIIPEDVWKSNNTYWLRQNIYNPEVDKLTEVFYEGLTKVIANHPALQSICLANEPIFKCGRDESNTPAWHEYLKKIYHNDVQQMNKSWTESFESFDDVPLQETYDNVVMFYDYLRFNDEMFAGWHERLANYVRSVAPNVPLHTKMMSIINYAEESWWGLESKISGGLDPEIYSKFLDINGNDCWNFIGTESTKTGISKNLWYDLMTSFRNAPCFNSEDHVIADRDEVYIDRMAPHCAADLWQGAIHGRSATAVWIWARTLSLDGDVAANIKHRPDAVALEGRTMLDLNRLSYEVEALQNQPAKTAILYSYPSRVYAKSCMNTIYQAYDQLSHSGIKARFVSETMLEQNTALEGIKLLVVPNAVSSTPGAVAAIRRFMENGGKVIVLGESLLYDTHKQPFADRSDADYILANATVVPGTVRNENLMDFDEDLSKLFVSTMKGLNEYHIEVVNQETGEPITTAEWAACEYNGKTLLNICHYDWSGDVTIQIKKDGRPVDEVLELRSGETYTGDITLKTSRPLLLQF